MEKELYIPNKIKIDSEYVDPNEIRGSDPKVVEIIGLGSGRGFELKNLNLPIDWDEQLDDAKAIDLECFCHLSESICQKWGYSVDEMIVDRNNILKKLSIINSKSSELSTIQLNSTIFSCQCDEYDAGELSDINSAMIFQEIMSKYFYRCWGIKNNFDYGHISCCPDGGMGNGYGPIDLKVPKKCFESSEESTDSAFQKRFGNKAINIAGRFGVGLNFTKFDEKGILYDVSVTGDRTGYCLSQSERSANTYTSHNIDTPYQAAALHGIVALFINYLHYRKVDIDF